ncbi:MAG: hypothetical protein KTR19_02460 [Hyphomicrobiales bacterium]|nr:hypothetical protein [Hyphomicrobiales bacterium]
MKTAPFSVAPVYLGIMGTCLILGAIIGAVLVSLSFNGWIVGTLCGFLPMFVASPLRIIIAKSLARTKDLDIEPPMVVNFPVRILLGAIISAIASYTTINSAEMPLGALSGGIIGLLTGAFIALLMTLRATTSD